MIHALALHPAGLPSFDIEGPEKPEGLLVGAYIFWRIAYCLFGLHRL